MAPRRSLTANDATGRTLAVMDPHLAAALAVAALVVVVTLVDVAGLARRRVLRLALDRAILAVLAASLLAIATGVALVIGGRAPRDALHLLYAAGTLITLPIARFAMPRLTVRGRGIAVLIGCAAMAGFILRLVQTG